MSMFSAMLVNNVCGKLECNGNGENVYDVTREISMLKPSGRAKGSHMSMYPMLNAMLRSNVERSRTQPQL